MVKQAKKQRANSLIQDLYNKCEKQANADKVRGIKNKLTQRDINRIAILAKRAYNSGYKVQYNPILEDINSMKTGINQISKPTLSRHIYEAGLVSSRGLQSLPKDLRDQAVPRWLARRRSFCKWWKGTPKEHWFVADGSNFGLQRKVRRGAKTLHPRGAKRPQRPVRGSKKNQVHVWCAVGLTSISNMNIWEDGKASTAEEFVSTLEVDVLPDLLADDPEAKIL